MPNSGGDEEALLSPLHRAAYEGNVAGVREAVAGGVSPNTRASKLGLTPLHLAAAAGHVAVVAELLTTPGIDVLAEDDDDERLTPVHAAARCGHADVLALLLDDPRAAVGVNVTTGVGGVTLLHAAASGGPSVGNLACVKLLIDRGAAVDALDAAGLSPLAEAARVANLGAVRALLAAGANPNARLPPGAPTVGAPGAGAVGVTPLHLAVFNADTRDAVAVVEALAAGGAATATADDIGVTPLHAALARPRAAGLPAGTPPDVVAEVGKYRDALVNFIVRLLLRYGAPVDARDAAGATALHQAARHGWGEAVFTLLDAGANASLRTNSGDTPATAAAAAGEATLAKILAAAEGYRPAGAR